MRTSDCIHEKLTKLNLYLLSVSQVNIGGRQPIAFSGCVHDLKMTKLQCTFKVSQKGINVCPVLFFLVLSSFFSAAH